MRALKRVVAVAALTGTEGLRQPAFFVLLVCAVALTALAPQFAVFHLGEDAKMVTDLGLSTILTFSTLLALLTASTTITDEIEGRTALTMLAKPLRREEFLLGKYLGVVFTVGAFVLLMTVILMATPLAPGNGHRALLEAVAALKQAGIGQDSPLLRDGLDTVVGNRGEMLSGGERQRLTIARALVRDPAILLLDEPTSMLDHENKALIGRVIRSIAHNRTVIIASHDPFLREMADIAVEMNAGRAGAAEAGAAMSAADGRGTERT